MEKYRITTKAEAIEIIQDLGAHYDGLSKIEQNEVRESLLEQFSAEHQTDPKYIENPSVYIRMNFRPKLQYIRAVSGTDFSDATLRRLLKATADKT